MAQYYLRTKNKVPADLPIEVDESLLLGLAEAYHRDPTGLFTFEVWTALGGTLTIKRVVLTMDTIKALNFGLREGFQVNK